MKLKANGPKKKSQWPQDIGVRRPDRMELPGARVPELQVAKLKVHAKRDSIIWTFEVCQVFTTRDSNKNTQSLEKAAVPPT